MPLTLPAVCLVSDRRAYPPDGMVAAMAGAARAGVTLVQVRERDLDDRALLRLVRAALAAVAGTATRVLVNDRTDIALAAGAHGVHLRSDSAAAARVRTITPAGFLIGRSVHDAAEAAAVEADGGCDYLLFGTVYPSASKPPGHAAAGIDALAGVCRAARLPVIAIGGITSETAPRVAEAGAAGIAAIRAFAVATDMPTLVAALRRPFDTSSGLV